MNFQETAITFQCGDCNLLGILSKPDISKLSVGVLVIVGGPQYRVGSHRQFTLLARELGRCGYPVFRFDYRGMGDSEGDRRDFESIGSDIEAAIDTFHACCPELRGIVLWGLCDAASAAMFYGPLDRRVDGMILLNPWGRTQTGVARTYLKHYYLARLLDAQFWRKFGRGTLDLRASSRFLVATLRDAIWPAAMERGEPRTGSYERVPLPERMLDGLKRFRGAVLVVLSGNDLVADEFRELVHRTRAWREALAPPRTELKQLEQATHTFSSRIWRDQVAAWTLDWLKAKFPPVHANGSTCGSHRPAEQSVEVCR